MSPPTAGDVQFLGDEGSESGGVEGPRFSTRAESLYYRGFADVIGIVLQ